MKVHMVIAQGFKRGQLNKWFEESPDAAIDPVAKLAAVSQWVNDRYGKWLEDQKIRDYDVYEVTNDYFRVNFLHDTDALAFLKQIGGTVIEE